MELTSHCGRIESKAHVDHALEELHASTDVDEATLELYRRRLYEAFDVAMNHWEMVHRAHQSERNALDATLDREALLRQVPEGLDTLRLSLDLIIGDMFGSLAGTTSRFMAERWDEHVMRRAGLELMIALDRYAHKHGTYPQQLSGLVPEYLDALPKDPFARDGAFIYRREDPHGYGAHGGYLLYSVGADCKDDGGAVAVDADGVRSNPRALRGGEPGPSDYIVNLSDRNG